MGLFAMQFDPCNDRALEFEEICVLVMILSHGLEIPKVEGKGMYARKEFKALLRRNIARVESGYLTNGESTLIDVDVLVETVFPVEECLSNDRLVEIHKMMKPKTKFSVSSND